MNAQQGWQCPLCKTVYAPHIQKCDCTKQEDILKKEYNNQITLENTCEHNWDCSSSSGGNIYKCTKCGKSFTPAVVKVNY